MKDKFSRVFEDKLGTCRTHVVSNIPFKHELPWKSQGGNPIIGPVEEKKVLEEVEKLVKLGVVREVEHEPYLIPVFGILKKSGKTG